MNTDLNTPDKILSEAGLSIIPGEGYATLRLELSRNLLGDQTMLRLEAVDPMYPRRKPVNLLRAAGIADVLVANDGEGAPELLSIIGEALRKAV